MARYEVSHIELVYEEDTGEGPVTRSMPISVDALLNPSGSGGKTGKLYVNLDAALRSSEEPRKKKGWWRKFWDWVWG